MTEGNSSTGAVDGNDSDFDLQEAIDLANHIDSVRSGARRMSANEAKAQSVQDEIDDKEAEEASSQPLYESESDLEELAQSQKAFEVPYKKVTGQTNDVPMMGSGKKNRFRKIIKYIDDECNGVTDEDDTSEDSLTAEEEEEEEEEGF